MPAGTCSGSELSFTTPWIPDVPGIMHIALCIPDAGSSLKTVSHVVLLHLPNENV